MASQYLSCYPTELIIFCQKTTTKKKTPKIEQYLQCTIQQYVLYTSKVGIVKYIFFYRTNIPVLILFLM